MHHPLTLTAIPLDPQRVVRPWSHLDRDQDAAVPHWQSLLDAGLIPNRNPPAPPAIVAQREANDALFRGFGRDRARSRARARF